MEHKIKQSLSELMLSEPMKRATKLLVSVSVFSMVFSYLSWRSHPILEFPIQLLSHALDKNYMFLICNCILVLLAKTSGCLERSAGRPCYDDIIMNDDDLHHAPYPHHAKLLLDFSLLHKEADLVESRLALLENAYSDDDNLEEEEEEEDDEHVTEEEEEKEEEKHVIEEEGSRSLMIITGDKQDDDDDDDDEKLNDDGVLVEEEKEVAEERERLNKLSAGELNKKFEEFIRKMKEDIRIEAQQQHYLVLVK